MNILTLKLTLTPLLVILVSLAGRRWGSWVSGWLTGLPLTSGPISLILALQYGLPFAAQAASGALGGIASVGAFCLAYAFTAAYAGWAVSLGAGLLAFFLSVLAWGRISLGLTATFAAAVAVLWLVRTLIPRREAPLAAYTPAWWDLPARMAAATGLLVLLTAVAGRLGPQLSGLLSPFPVFTTVLVTFIHRSQGGPAAVQFLRGLVTGTFSYAVFFLVVGALLAGSGIGWAYALAALAAVLVNMSTLRLVRS